MVLPSAEELYNAAPEGEGTALPSAEELYHAAPAGKGFGPLSDLRPGSDNPQAVRDLLKTVTPEAAAALVDPNLRQLRYTVGQPNMPTSARVDQLQAERADVEGRRNDLRKVAQVVALAPQAGVAEDDPWLDAAKKSLQFGYERIPNPALGFQTTKAAVSGAGQAAKLLGYGAQAARALTMPGGGLFDWEEAENPADWHKAMRNAAEAGQVGPQAFESVKKAIADTAGTAVAYPMAGAFSGAALAAGTPFEDVKALWPQTVEDIKRTTGEEAMTTAFDPLVWLPQGSGTKVASAVERGGMNLARGTALERALASLGGVPGESLAGVKAVRGTVKDAYRTARGYANEHGVEAAQAELRKVLGARVGKVNQPEIDRLTAELRRLEEYTKPPMQQLDLPEVLEAARPRGGAPGPMVGGGDSLPRPIPDKGPFAAEPRVPLNPQIKQELEMTTQLLKAAQQPQLPPHAEEAIAALRGTGLGSLSEWLRSQKTTGEALKGLQGTAPVRLGREALAKTAELVEGFVTMTKQHQLLNDWQYNITNTVTDLMLMASHGFTNPARFVQAKRMLEGKDESAKTLKRVFDLHNPESKLRHAVPGEPELGGGSTLKQLATGTWTDQLPAWVPMGRNYIEKWDRLSRGAMWLDRLKKGDGPESAARAVANALPDYGNLLGLRNRAIQTVRWALPYANWYLRAPVSAALGVANNPRRVALMLHAKDALSSDDPMNPGRDLGPAINVGATGERLAMSAAGVPGQSPTGQIQAPMPFPITDALGLPAALAPTELGGTPGWDAARQILGSQLSQPLQAGVQGAFGVDPRTGEKAKLGAGGVVQSLATQAFLDPWMQEALNTGLYKAGKAAGVPGVGPTPLSPFDKPSDQPELDIFLRRLGLFTPKPSVATPEGELRNRAKNKLGELRNKLGPASDVINRSLFSKPPPSEAAFAAPGALDSKGNPR